MSHGEAEEARDFRKTQESVQPAASSKALPAFPLHVVLLSSYTLVAIVFTFPLIGHLTTAFPDGNDAYGFIWNNWWIHYSVTTLHTRPYFTDFIFAPFLVDLRLHTFGLLYGLISIPLMPLLTPVGVLNAQILATIVLNGYSTCTLTAYVTKSHAAGFVSGLIVASTPAINFHLTVGRASCAALWPAIFAMLALLRLVDRRDRRTSVWLAVSLIATMLADQQAALFCACWLTVLLGFLVISRPLDVANRRFLAAAGAAAAIAFLPAYLLYWKPFARTPGYTVPGAVEALTYSFPVRLFWSPSIIWAVYGVVMPLGFVAALGLIRRIPAVVPWVLGSGLFVLLALGPVATGTRVPLPFSLVQALPGLAQFRTPYRFQIPAAIGLAVVVGIIVSYGLKSFGRKRGQLVLIGTVVLTIGDLLTHRIVSGFKIQTMPRAEAVYEEIARDNRNCLVLEVPVGVRTGTDRIGPGEALSFYQPVHHKRMINGLIARAPLAALDYYRASPALMFLANETPPAGDVTADLRRRIRELSVGYVVIHTDMMDDAWVEKTLELFNRIDGLHRLDTTAGIIAFRVETPDR